ncbi:MAG TPA: hypothetical protein DDY13_02910 [Cytophagales bacterium]|jgi:hypothetical protein|nr:hypothetical protein [Cytophagales bacterium]
MPKTSTFSRKKSSIIYLLFTLGLFLFLSIDALAVGEIAIRIDNGRPVTNEREVTVEVRSLKTPTNLVRQMRIGVNPDLSDAKWTSFSSAPVKMKLSEGDGEKFIYAQLKDQAGNESPINSSSIMLDTQPPQNCAVTINGGRLYTNDKQGRVLLKLDADEAVQMQVSNSTSFNIAWEGYANTKRWILDLSGGDGVKKVYARFRDAAGNISETVEGGINLDTREPTNGFIQINEGEEFIKSTNVKLKIKADDAARVRVVSRGRGLNFDYSPEDDGFMYIDWTLDSAQGTKVVKAYFQDEARNSTQAPVEARTIYDTKPPSPPKFQFIPKVRYTNDPNGKVNLQIQANPGDVPNKLTMLVSNFEDFSVADTMSFRNSLTWTLDAEEDGLKKVFIKLCDEAKNYSDASFQGIILDREPPVTKRFVINDSAEWTNNAKVALMTSVEGAATMQINNNGIFNYNLPWLVYDSIFYDWELTPGEGEKTVYIRFKDAAENVSEVSTANIKLDTQNPEGTLLINGGKKFTNHPQGMVNLELSYDTDVVGMKIANTPYLDSVKLMPVEPIINSWELSQGDGIKTVFVRLIDQAGNNSKIIYEKILLDRTPPSEGSITINGGSEWITQPDGKTVLTLQAADAQYMIVSSNPDLANAEWEEYKPTIPWTVSKKEGYHAVYVKFKDQAGNESDIYSDSIKAKFSAPIINSFTINKGAEYTNDPQKTVRINLEAEDAVEMLVSNVPTRSLQKEKMVWKPLSNQFDWVLSNEDGSKVVFLRLRNEAGNVSTEYRANIILDRIPPVDGRVIINKNTEWMTNRDGRVEVQLYAKDASHYAISNNNDFSAPEWKELTLDAVNWNIPVDQDEATVYAQFKDEAGNISDIFSASIKVDVEPPKNAGIEINNGDKYLPKDGQADISISVEGATEMRISSQESFPGVKWEPLQPSKTIILSGKDGKRNILAQFRDKAGNESEIVSASIMLDNSPPELQKISINDGAEWSNAPDKEVKIQIFGEEAVEMMVSQKEDLSDGRWMEFKNDFSIVLEGEDGLKNIYVKLKDEAGNESRVVSSSIKLKREF